MDFKNMNPVPASLTFKGKDDLTDFCRRRTSNRDDASKLHKLISPIAFNSKRFSQVIAPLIEAANKDPQLEKSWCASTDLRKENIIYPHIAAHPRCTALAARLSITLESAARVVYKAAFPQLIDFMTVQKLAENCPLMNWLIENSEVTDGHFDRAHACLAEEEASRTAAAACLAEEEASRKAAAAAEAERIAADCLAEAKKVAALAREMGRQEGLQASAAAIEAERARADKAEAEVASLQTQLSDMAAVCRHIMYKTAQMLFPAFFPVFQIDGPSFVVDR